MEDETPDSPRGPLVRARQLLSLISTYGGTYVTRRFAAATLLLLIASAMTPMAPAALKQVIDHFTGVATGPATLGVAIVLYVVSQFAARLLSEASIFLYFQGERRMLVSTCQRFFSHALHLPFTFHSGIHAGGVSQMRENGLQGLQAIVQPLFVFVLPCLTQIGVTTWILFRIDQPMFLSIFCLAICCYSVTIGYFTYKTMASARGALDAQVCAGAVMGDSLTNFEPVKLFAAETIVEGRVERTLLATELKWNAVYRSYAARGAVASLLSAAFVAITILLGTRGVVTGTMSIGEFVLVNTYMLQLLPPIDLITHSVQQMSRGWAMVQQFLKVLEERTETDSVAARMLTPQSSAPAPALTFSNVSVCYGTDRQVLHNLSFVVPPGKTLGIVGASGSGKTTLVRLLTRLVDPTAGRILMDDVPLSDLPLQAVRRAVAVVPQDTILFNESIRYNIALGRAGCSDREVEQAARIARLHDFICSLPQGYDTRVGERGVKISGGERQRVSIARAVLKAPKVYVFDEATSSLDSATERLIMKDLLEISSLATVLVIAHRLSTVVHADEIIVLERGVACERGTHAELLRRRGRYSVLWEAQGHHATSRLHSETS